MLIHLEKLGKSFGEKIVLHDVTASVEREDRIKNSAVGLFAVHLLGDEHVLHKVQHTALGQTAGLHLLEAVGHNGQRCHLGRSLMRPCAPLAWRTASMC